MTAPLATMPVRRWPHHVPPAPAYDATAVGACAARCLIDELETWPKPGLVSHVDSGSHSDMSADSFRASAAAIAPYFALMAEAGNDGCDMRRLRAIGLDAEAAMLRVTGGVNTHRGAIFGLGLLCAASGIRARAWGGATSSLGELVSHWWGQDIENGPVLLHSHGTRALGRYGAGGARREAATGFPSVYRIGVPALCNARLKAPNRDEDARVETCFALIASVEDTNLLHRGGLSGLRLAQRTARSFLLAGGISAPGWRETAQSAHSIFVAHGLSPGGAADLLAMTLFVAAQEGGSP